MHTTNIKTDLVVIGSGPGGYTAAFRAADLGQQVLLVERYSTLGGVCLNVGCIPSKALLHVAKVLDETQESSTMGIIFAKPQLNRPAIVAWKDSIVKKLTQGLQMLAKQRKVQVIQGEATFVSANQLRIQTASGEQLVDFMHAIIAVGSEAVSLPFIPEDPRIFSATGGLKLNDIQGELMVLGGGIIGLEMATVYSAMGVKVTVVEFMDQLMPGTDADLVKILQKRMEAKGVRFLLQTKVTAVAAKQEGLYVTLEGKHAGKDPICVQQILVAVGRKPNGANIAADVAGVIVDKHGFIAVDKQMRTNIPHIFAIGDVAGQPMLAHKAIPEGRTAAEVIAGKKHYFEPRCIPSVAYTDPEIAWAGLTEVIAKAANIKYTTAIFPWVASGRALSIGRAEGMTKLLFCPDTKRLLGAGIVGVGAGDLIAEIVLAIEMECDVEDIALSIHPHPTVSETIALSAEIFAGTITDLYMPKKKSD